MLEHKIEYSISPVNDVQVTVQVTLDNGEKIPDFFVFNAANTIEIETNDSNDAGEYILNIEATFPD